MPSQTISDPLVTLVIPARNEVRSLTWALDAIARQDYPHERLEVLVVDGDSTDGTFTVAAKWLEKGTFREARVLSNPARSTPTSLNLGLSAASGDYLCRIDARSLVPPEYVRRCVELLAERPEVAVVGGRQLAIAGTNAAQAHGIARALNNRWTMGLARYRRGAPSGQADTVYLGAFRTNDLRRVGGWDERLDTNQDFDLSRRLAEHGLVWFDASMRVEYIGRSDLHSLWRQYVRFGSWKVEYWRLTGERPLARQLVGLLGPPAAGLITIAWVAGGRRTRWRAALAAGALVTSLTAVDAAGAAEEGSPALPVRIAAIAAIATVVTGWCWGAFRALARRPT